MRSFSDHLRSWRCTNLDCIILLYSKDVNPDGVSWVMLSASLPHLVPYILIPQNTDGSSNTRLGAQKADVFPLSRLPLAGTKVTGQKKHSSMARMVSVDAIQACIRPA